MEYQEFFKSVKGFLKQAEIHKRSGNNDFNPYLEMWSKSNEVKLHSALICGFLNPLGEHYQGDVFLETFLESVGLKAWFGDTNNARVYKEYKIIDISIDIFITNGNRHIIIENKIKAGDQPQQIERYIEKIAKGESKEQSVSYENIAVLYLAPYKRNPSKDSLGEWEIQGDYLVNGDNQVRFKAITYEKEILKWIENSQAKVGCITNLNAALLFYKDVVQIITKTKENTMSIEHFLTDNNMEENMKMVYEILKNRENIIETYHEKFVGKVIEGHKEQIESKDFEIVKTDKNKDKLGKWKHHDLSYPFIIKPKDCGEYYYAFCVEYYMQENRYSFYGVRIFHKDLTFNAGDPRLKDIQTFLGQGGNKPSWWLYRNKDTKWRYEFDILLTEFESKLQEFLKFADDIKALNEKLKSY
ncbi:PD-(D/E)XK nuclease family protein [Helicobacter sp.]|uniref:PDDEXK-like family protein n=1 Tax=Helicobacter sp. TaxID=218 RepID=UPI002A764508|nr:PD-(D/E)XK nuclease family protein [Helicobacter sp.]MDY2585410.1 PD-(D/E)XK nuclease family protein [Helicobacter sp.]